MFPSDKRLRFEKPIHEVEKKLARSRLKMGGDTSVYVKHLLARKAELEAGQDNET